MASSAAYFREAAPAREYVTMRSTATASDQTLMMASTMAMNFANGPMVRHMFTRSKDIAGSVAASTSWLRTSVTGRDICLFSWGVSETVPPYCRRTGRMT